MTARKCFLGKIAAGRVSARAGAQLLDMLEAFEREHQGRLGDGAGARQAALETAAIVKADAARRADEVRDTLVAQSNVLRAFAAYDAEVVRLRGETGDFSFGNKAPITLQGETKSTLLAAVRSLLMRDPWEISTWNNAYYLAREIRGRAHAAFAEAIEYLRPKAAGFKTEAVRELDVLRVLYGRADVEPGAKAAADAWSKAAGAMADEFIAAGGKLTKRETWRLPNPDLDEAKIRAAGAERFKADARAHVDRAQMLDFATGKPLNDARFEQLLDEAAQGFLSGWVEGPPTAAFKGRRMLANQRDFSRFFVWKDAEAWQFMAEKYGSHQSVFDTMMGHFRGMADDIGLMRTFGNNPEASKRFILDLFDREAARLAVTAENDTPKALAAAARANKRIEGQVRRDRKQFEDLFAEVTGLNKIPVNTAMAKAMGDMRSWLTATQLGQAIISSFSDAGTLMVTSRLNGLPVMNIISRATMMMGEKGSEIFVAQMGLVADSLAHTVGQVDRMAGEEIRSGVAGKLAAGVIRASGLRRWTAVLRGAFGLEMMAHVARERGTAFGELEPLFRGSLERYGIGAEDWKLIQAAQAYEPRPNALFVRPADVRELGHPAAIAASEKLSRLINTEMDYAVIDHDPLARALILGDTRPGTIKGEAFRAVGQYKSFPLSFVTLHFARAFARGFDGTRLAHGALTFLAMTAIGALSMQAKEINAGRDPLSLDPTTGIGARAWGKAMLQGGGLGVFGDMLFVDQTKYGNTWAATAAGPQFAALEAVLGDFLIKNVQLAAKGKETHFLGDAAYVAGRYVPGESLFYAKLAFQRGVLDQAALMLDPRARERFGRIEQQAREEFGQSHWWRPGRLEPARAPELGAVAGKR